GQNPYGQGDFHPHQSPQAPERKPRKRYAGTTLISGMVAAALIGGVTAAGTTYLINPNSSGTAQVQSPQDGVVINN
ncbi:hypothetical protein NSP61_25550, partial [Salmonella enterica]|nr:hypothetical protein [Salmonella enterica]